MQGAPTETPPGPLGAAPAPVARALISFGRVWHARQWPRVHAFQYPACFLMLPLRTLARSPDPLVARNRFSALGFRDRDHGEGGADALTWFDGVLRSHGLGHLDGEVWLHTLPSTWGHAFKPVSFWYAHHRDGRLGAILAEVNNTFGERHCYLLHKEALCWGVQVQADKCFHVSPFCKASGEYRFRFDMRHDEAGQPALTRVAIEHLEQGRSILKTAVHGRLEPLSAASRRRAAWQVSAMSLAVLARIHWQALQLWCKRIPFHRQPAPPERFVTR